jgi:hypothetical protein
LYPGIFLTTEKKAGKTLNQGKKNFSQVKKNLSEVKKNLSHSTVYILPKTPTHYKALTALSANRAVNSLNLGYTKPVC